MEEVWRPVHDQARHAAVGVPQRNVSASDTAEELAVEEALDSYCLIPRGLSGLLSSARLGWAKHAVEGGLRGEILTGPRGAGLANGRGAKAVADDKRAAATERSNRSRLPEYWDVEDVIMVGCLDVGCGMVMKVPMGVFCEGLLVCKYSEREEFS
jgi:hypothetical protein